MFKYKALEYNISNKFEVYLKERKQLRLIVLDRIHLRLIYYIGHSQGLFNKYDTVKVYLIDRIQLRFI